MSTGKHIAALILAAGYSSRMGTCKPLLPMGDSTILEQTLSRFLQAGIHDVRVVLG
jgi:molybdenum cofactor cytidylyltransferase